MKKNKQSYRLNIGGIMKKQVGLIIILLFIGCLFLQADASKKELSLKDAISHALEHNLDLQVQIIDAEVSRKDLKISKTRLFIPTFSASGNLNENNSASDNALSGKDGIVETTQKSLNLSLTQNLPYGGNIAFEIYGHKRSSNTIMDNPNPSFYSQARLVLTQPLLKGFGLTATKREIYVNANNLKMAKHLLKQNILDMVFNVEEAYWNLVYSHQNLGATKLALQRAKDLLKQNEIKVRVGSAAPIEILEAKAEVASNESTVIQAERNLQTAEENLKRILNMSKEDTAIFPSEKPEVKKVTANYNQYLEEALNNRPDIQRAKLDLGNNKINVKYYKNQTLPELQLTAAFYSTGRAGTRFIYADGWEPFYEGFDPEVHITGTDETELSDALSTVFDRQYKNYEFGLQLTMPVILTTEKTELAKARVQMKQRVMSLKNVENTIYSEVKDVIKELESNAKLVEANSFALELEGQKLKAEEKKLSVGISTNFNVRSALRDYAAAETRALQSNIAYITTLARINRTLARTFKAYDIKFKNFVKK